MLSTHGTDTPERLRQVILFEAHLGELRGLLKLKVEHGRMGFLYMKSTAISVTAYIAIFQDWRGEPVFISKACY